MLAAVVGGLHLRGHVLALCLWCRGVVVGGSGLSAQACVIGTLALRLMSVWNPRRGVQLRARLGVEGGMVC